MKVILNEEQLKQYKKFLIENVTDEGRALPKVAARTIKKHTDDVLRGLYGDKFGTKDEKNSEVYGVAVTYDGEIYNKEEIRNDLYIVPFSLHKYEGNLKENVKKYLKTSMNMS